MNTPLVSIITPCYNAAATISQTIESVLAQTYENWEMLVIDNCSTDNSASFIKSYVEQDNRIKYLKTDRNSGSSAMPRNVGMENAIGEYIAMLDADDLWLPEKLAEQIDFLETNHYGFVYSDYEKMTFDGMRNDRIIKGRTVSTYRNTLGSNDIPCLTVLIRKELLNKVRFEFDPPGREDWVVWLKLLKAENNAYNTGKVHALYRQAKTSLTGNKYTMLKKQWYVLRKIEKIMFLPAIYYILIYMCKGYLKYRK